ncbi:hypothetical protein A3K73_05255, partial [Candidatus Pacearchaeota archaeon RBG_13_36_9]
DRHYEYINVSILPSINFVVSKFQLELRYLGRITSTLFRQELLEDPGDLIANYVLKLVSELSLGVQIFAALYLLIHGLIKVGLVAALWRRKLRAYPLSEVILILFMASQIYAYYFSHSLLMLALTILDAFVIVLIWLEYKSLRNKIKVSI